MTYRLTNAFIEYTVRHVNTVTLLPVGLLTALPMWISYSLWISWISIFSQRRF